MAAGDTENAPERKPFALVLQEMRKGGLHTELGDELAELVLQCVKTGKKGSLQITLEVDPGDEGMVRISDKIGVKAPRFDTAKTTYWSDEKGNLQRNRPNQPELPLRGLNGGDGRDKESRDTAAGEM